MSSKPSSRITPNGARRRRRIAIVLVGFALAALWAFKARGTGWSNAINPLYWYHRIRGDDLYRQDGAMLLHGNRDLPEVALTFDDGPHPESRSVILDILKRRNLQATFFDVGINMEAHPEYVLRTLSQGSEIGNHSQTHSRRLDTLNERDRHREINDADIEFTAITGKHLYLLRPPGMRYNQDVLADTFSLGYIVVGYTTASRDFDPNEPPDEIAERTLSRCENGSILLLHDYPATATALPRIIDGLAARGLKCVTISQMLAHLPQKPGAAAAQFIKSHSL